MNPRSASLLLLLLLLALSISHPRAQVVAQLTDYRAGASIPAAISRDGLTIVFPSSGDLVGTNANHAFQIFKTSVIPNTTTQLTTSRVGGGVTASVSKDGLRIAFTSQADLTGGNHDQSLELFVMNADGTGIRQLTSSSLGSTAAGVISGNGQKVVFSSSADLTGGNADHSIEVFVINWDGTGLRQLTSSTGDSTGARISDDGTRVVFASSANLTGGNADLTSEIYAIGADGTGLRQVTSSTGDSTAPFVSGNGLKIVFQSSADLIPGGNTDLGDEIFIVNWDGTGLKQLTNSLVAGGLTTGISQSPSTDDLGATVVFHSNLGTIFPLQNLDGNFEIWKISASGTGLTALTSSLSLSSFGSFFPILSGDGTRVVFEGLSNVNGGNPDGNAEIFTVKTDKTALTQHTNTRWGFTTAPSMSTDGSRIAFVSSSDLTGSDTSSNAELYRIESDGSGLTRLTSATTGDAGAPSITGDGTRIVFQSGANYLGSNSDASTEIFMIGSDGSGFAQLTSDTIGSSQAPRISADGSKIVFQSTGNLTGQNSDGSTEIFAIAPDGGGLLQLTSSATGDSTAPAISADGSLVVFRSTSNLAGTNPDGNGEIFAVGSGGGGLRQLTSSSAGSSDSPDLSGDGQWTAFSSTADLVAGQNADGNREIFLVRTDGTSLRQLTNTTTGSNDSPAISGDGSKITFASSAPLFQANPDELTDLYQIDFDGSGLRRLTAVHTGTAGAPVSSRDGSRIAFSGSGNFTGQNPDLLPEIFIVDLGRPWRIAVSGKSSTVLTWPTRAGAWSYDAIRGQVEQISETPTGVDLGADLCLENDSPDTDTLGFEDTALPIPGRAFFYLVRSFDGQTSSDYGASSDGKTEVSGTGDCTP